MSLRINTNIQSMNAQNKLHENKTNLERTQTRLATGSRIVLPMDDAAGLAISENLRAAQRATTQNIKNAQNGFFLLQTADGALSQLSDIVIRMKELAVSASSDTNGPKERTALDAEYQSLKQEMERIVQSTLYNGRKLLVGGGEDVEIQVGPNNSDLVDRIRIASNYEVDTNQLELASLEVSSREGAREALEPIGNALDKLAQLRGAIGGSESRLNTTIKSLSVYEENTASAFSQIRDADIAFETSELTKNNILSQAGIAVLAQANSIPQMALKLLG